MAFDSVCMRVTESIHLTLLLVCLKSRHLCMSLQAGVIVDCRDMFERMDANQSGALSSEELTAGLRHQVKTGSCTM